MSDSNSSLRKKKNLCFYTCNDLQIVSRLQKVGADVNLQSFRGYATAAAAREGHYEILEILLKAGASQPACEEALLEVGSHGHSQLVELLMGSDLIRPHIAVHALVTACCRGFVEVVDNLMKVYLWTHTHIDLYRQLFSVN